MSDLRIHSILLPATVLGTDLSFYRALLGVEPLFVDGGRYAALPPSDGVGLALAAGEEAVADRPALVLRTADLDAAVRRVVELGGSVLAKPVQGPHELRAVVADPCGNPLVISQKS